MKKDIWLKPGKQINNGAIVGGIGFVLYMAFSALGWSGIALIVAIGFGLESLYTFLSTLEWREKDKESVSYSIMWGDGGAGAADAGSGRHDHQAGTGTVRLAACRKGDIPIPARARPK